MTPCCHIDGAGNSCGKPADFHVYEIGTDRPRESDVYACAAHLGDVMSFAGNAVDGDTPHWLVYVVGQAALSETT